MIRTLIIDDEAPARKAIVALGKWTEYTLEKPAIAYNGREGLQVMRELKPEIVVVDMNMPIMNGIDFLQLARQEFPKVKYIVVSGYDDFEYAHAAIRSGAIDYLLKPIMEKDLNEALLKAARLVLNQPNFMGKASEICREENIAIDQIVEMIKEYVDKNFCEEISVHMFSERYYFTKEYLSKAFKKKYNIGIYEYALSLRMNRAKELLQNYDIPIKEVGERLAYSNSNYFSKAFKNFYGISPKEFRDQ